MTGGPEGHGSPGLPCASCHQRTNTPLVGATLRSVPGNPKWALAPVEMAWVGRSLGQICEQLKDPKRNGGKSLEALHHHMAEDVLVEQARVSGIIEEAEGNAAEVLTNFLLGLGYSDVAVVQAG